jgi:cell division protein DivIC
MEFIQKINSKKMLLISIFLFLYTLINLLDGERGLISYYHKKEIKKSLSIKKEILTSQLSTIEKKNNLLINQVDLDYLDILFRQKFMVGKSDEKIYLIK